MTVDQLATLITDLEKRVTELEGAGAPVGARKAPLDQAETRGEPKKDTKHER